MPLPSALPHADSHDMYMYFPFPQPPLPSTNQPTNQPTVTTTTLPPPVRPPTQHTRTSPSAPPLDTCGRGRGRSHRHGHRHRHAERHRRTTCPACTIMNADAEKDTSTRCIRLHLATARRMRVLRAHLARGRRREAAGALHGWHLPPLHLGASRGLRQGDRQAAPATGLVRL